MRKGESVKERIIVFGAGEKLDSMIKNGQLDNYEIVAIVDSDTMKQKESRYGHDIKKPEEIHKLDYDKIIISSERHYDEIKAMLIDEFKIPLTRIGEKTWNKYMNELDYWKIQYQREGGFNNSHYKNLMLAIAEEENDDFWKNKVVADFGCGPRGSLSWTKTPAVKLGIDVLAGQYMKNFGDELSKHDMIYVVSDEKRIMIPDSYVDYLLTMNSLDHVDNMELMVSEILRILKPGGKLLASFNLNEPSTECEPQTLTEELLKEHLLKYFKIDSYRMAFRDNKHTYRNMLNNQLISESDNGKPVVLWVKGEKL